MPESLAVGVPYELFWHLSPKKLKAFHTAYMIKEKNIDSLMWVMGKYVLSATVFAIDHALNKKAKSQYIEKPILSDMEYAETAQVNADDRELRKMLLAEQKWQSVYAQKGLPPTLIK